MQLRNQFSICLLVGTLIFSSCTKEKTESPDEALTVALTTEQASAENFVEDDNSTVFELTADRNVQGAGFSSGGAGRFFTGCGTVTVSSNATYFKIITVDYGTGCTSQGVLRSGKVILGLTDSLRRPGSRAVLTFDNYFVNTVKREGIITYTNQSTPGVPTWERKVENGKLIFTNGFFTTHNSINVVAQTGGVSTPNIHIDDEFTITGQGAVANSNGNSRTYRIVIALLKKANCANIVSGRKRIESGSNYAVLDYGDGTCDRIATISFNGGPLRTILLRN